jgi:hypothetical protein
MFSFRRDEDWPGFSVGVPENPPGFRIADDGSPLSTLMPQPMPLSLQREQAGLTLEETLDIAGMYARLRSSNADKKGQYGLDPRRLHYITRGHEIGRTGMFDDVPARR